MVNAKIKGLIIQFSKFVVVGFINTAIDFAFLNLLSFWTGVYSGAGLILINSISFAVAVINSYFMNKYWVFGTRDKIETVEVSKFLSVSIVGLGINTAIVYGITTFVGVPLPQITPALWENIAKIFATGGALVWNFIGYRVFVFKKQVSVENVRN